MTKSPNEIESWDVFMAHAGADLPAATALCQVLTNAHARRCFLDANELRPGHGWPVRLKRALASSRVVAVIVSSHSDDAYYLQEEVAIAIALHRKHPDALTIIPILLREARHEHLPYGTFKLHALREGDGGWAAIAADVDTTIARLPERPAEAALSNSVELLDRIWAGLEGAVTDRDQRMPEEYRMRYRADGDDLVARHRDGRELQRVTHADLQQRLSSDDLRRLAVLERSMEINLALWEDRYPERALDKRSRRAAEEAIEALADDLGGVLDLVERSGFWLDDHYQLVRDVVGQHSH